MTSRLVIGRAVDADYRRPVAAQRGVAPSVAGVNDPAPTVADARDREPARRAAEDLKMTFCGCAIIRSERWRCDTARALSYSCWSELLAGVTAFGFWVVLITTSRETLRPATAPDHHGAAQSGRRTRLQQDDATAKIFRL